MDSLPPHRRTDQQCSGDAAEQRALAYLLRHGLRLQARNFRCKAGEIDLIMQDGETLVFVEVRQRSTMRYGGAAASVTLRKQMRVTRAAHWYLTRYSMPPPCRFDVLAFEADRVCWLKNAFTAA